MITIEGHKQKNKPVTSLNPQEVAVFRLIGLAAADQPKPLVRLLTQFGVKLPENPKAATLIDALIDSMGKQNESFNHKLAQILGNQVIPDAYDGFNTKDLAGAAHVTVGADPVSAIAGAIGTVFSFAGNLTNRKALKSQARKESMSSLIQMQQQQAQLIASRQEQAQKQAQKEQLMKLFGFIALAAVIGGIIWWQGKQHSAKPIPTNP